MKRFRPWYLNKTSIFVFQKYSKVNGVSYHLLLQSGTCLIVSLCFLSHLFSTRLYSLSVLLLLYLKTFTIHYLTCNFNFAKFSALYLYWVLFHISIAFISGDKLISYPSQFNQSYSTSNWPLWPLVSVFSISP